jgi:hypothetical protein
MKPAELRKVIEGLDEAGPFHKRLERDLAIGASFSRAWYSSQKEHWLGWLVEYDGPGAYGRSNWANRSAEFVYNHIQCAPMLLWLAEALSVSTDRLQQASEAVKAAGARSASQCAALRIQLPWALIERQIVARERSRVARIKARPIPSPRKRLLTK